MKIHVNADRPHMHAASWICRELTKMGMLTENPNAEIVWNIDSIHHKRLLRGSRLTIYWEGDDFMNPGTNGAEGWYDVDLLYIPHEAYLPHYPQGTRILRFAADPDVHKEHPGNKFCKYIFVGSIEPLGVYMPRLHVLDKALRSGADMYITYGTQENYVHCMSQGEVILNVLPRHESGRVCINQRFYEAMAIGCLMNDYDPQMDAIAQQDVHYVTFDKFLTITPEEIKRIKKASRQLIIEQHTWRHRVNQVINDIYEKLKA